MQAIAQVVMASIDLIASSFKAAWHAVPNDSLVSPANIYLDRAEQPSGLAGFPYIEMFIVQEGYEPRTQQSYQAATALVKYKLLIEVWTTQGQPGSSGDQITDQGIIQRAVDAILTKIEPGQAWLNVPGFVHCIKEPRATLEKYRELYLGKDVFKSVQSYILLCLE